MPVSLPTQSDIGTKVGTTIAHVFAIALCSVRLYVRVKNARVWWDDRLIFVVAILDVFYMSTLWTKHLGYGKDAHGETYINAWYQSFPGLVVMWLSRISLWLSLSRIYPPRHKARRLAFALAAFCVVLAIISIFGGVLGCEDSAGGTRLKLEKCYGIVPDLSKFDKFGAFSVAADLAADLLLVMVPAYLLSDVKLPRKQKLLIILLGSGSFLTLLSVIVVTVVLYGPFIHNDGWALVFEALSHMVAYLALIAANILVVGTAIYRRYEREDPNSAPMSTINPAYRPVGPMGTTFDQPNHHGRTYATNFTVLSEMEQQMSAIAKPEKSKARAAAKPEISMLAHRMTV